MLSRKQIQVARAVFEGQLNEAEIGREFRVSQKVLRSWLVCEEFQGELGRLCAESVHETRRILSRYGPTAAMQLASLLGSDKADTVRRAALDLVDRCLAGEKLAASSQGSEAPSVSDEQAQSMLLELAKGRS